MILTQALSYDNHLVDGQTDQQTDQQTDMSKAIYPLFFEGGHNEYEVLACLRLHYVRTPSLPHVSALKLQ
ncbi:hypothetical protein DPMN_033734 [Dreissena polymorpha]|uniref:Uncharacterized protein n=1 Tax=Dreissena polymorpha TaxID=45954 RepID=A0A9D4M4C2_DREPO|nr:hypothetical protein DPMN_033734 [Dreissena polymorpha]